MKQIINTLMEALEECKNREVAVFLLKKMQIAFLPLFGAIFLAAGLKGEFVGFVVTTAGLAWSFWAFSQACGTACRMIFLNLAKKEADAPRSQEIREGMGKFQEKFAASMILNPLIIFIANFMLITTFIGIMYVGAVPILGEIMVSLLFLPMVIILAAFFILSAAGLYFGWAIIAAEERNLTIVYRRFQFLLMEKTLLFLACLAAGIVASSFVAMLSFTLLWGGVKIIGALGFLVLPEKFAGIVSASLGGYSKILGMVPMENPPFSFLLAGFIMILSLGSIFAAAVTPWAIFTSASSVLLYNLMRGKIDPEQADKRPFFALRSEKKKAVKKEEAKEE